MAFPRQLIVKEHESLEWELVQPFSYEGNHDLIEVPAGFLTDFASVPWCFRWLIPRHGRYTKAAVIHDYLYVCRPIVGSIDDLYVITRKEADGMFRRIMRELGVPKWKRYLMWFAVRAGGWYVWNKRDAANKAAG